MKKNIKEKISNFKNHNLKNTRGITLVALVVTIIVLLILAGVSLSAVFSDRGIFSRAEKATDKYGQSKARETLELALSEAQMQKYEQGLTEEQLDEQIKKVGSLIPKEDPNSNNQLVIVDGHIFEIDRSVPKIIDYKGPADGIIITASVSQNGNWQNPVATVTGTITKYGGGTVISSSATATNGVTISGFPTAGGSYTIPNITTDTDITITAKDSEGHDPVKEIIKVRLVRDNTPPVLSNAKAEADRMKIKISVTATDDISGVAQINYTVEPNTVKLTTGEAGSIGTISSGEVIELTASEEKEYTVTFTATDNAGNTTNPGVTAKVTAIDGMTVAEAKRLINANNYPDYIGTKVIDYKSDDTVAWRVFFVEDSSNYFRDGEGTIYLKRDYDTSTTMKLTDYADYLPTTDEGWNRFIQMNPLWSKGAGGSTTDKTKINFVNECCAAWLCDNTQWKQYQTEYAKYVIGSPSIEMWTKAYNAYITKYELSDNKLNCGIKDETGYGWGLNGGELATNQNIDIDIKIPQSKVIATSGWQWVASPLCFSYKHIALVCNSSVSSDTETCTATGGSYGVCPVAALNMNY